MDNLRKLNVLLADNTKTINAETSDEEIDKFMKTNVGDFLEALNLMPKALRKMPIGALVDFYIKITTDGVNALDEMSEEELIEWLGLENVPESEDVFDSIEEEFEAWFDAMGKFFSDEDS